MPKKMSEKTIHPRIEYLDSVRGLAALCTLIGHWLFTFEDGRAISLRTAHFCNLFINGSDAVSLFFVLSGFVLSYKYFKTEDLNLNYKTFIINRLFRLYPAFWFMLILYFLNTHAPEMHGPYWKDWFWYKDYRFLEEASLLRSYTQLFIPGWTLNVELGLSFFVPFLILGMKYRPKWFHYLLVISVFANAYLNQFLFHFSLGIWIAAHFDAIRQFNFKQTQWYPYRWLLGLIIWIFYSMRDVLYFIPFDQNRVFLFLHRLTGINTYYITGLGAAMLLIIVIRSERIQRILQYPIFLFYGRIAYGIYLTHCYFLFGQLKHRSEMFKKEFHWNDLQTFWFIGLATLVLSTLLATFIYYVIEKPMIRYGRSIAQRYE
jgi:peptidoglycan/LPS O-acetylase OafA/YrhL